MELLHGSFLFASLLFLLLWFRAGCGSKSGNPGSKLPPGPTALPIIGSIHHLLLRSPLPHRALRDLARTHGPLMHLRLGQLPVVVVSSPEAAREVMKSRDATFATRHQTAAIKALTYGGVDLLFAPYGEHWRQLRKFCVLELLSAKRVQSSRAMREEEVRGLVRSIGSMSGSSSPVNMSRLFSALTNDITVRAALGFKCKDQTRYFQAMKEATKWLSGFKLVDFFPRSTLVRLITGAHKLQRSHREIDGVLDGAMKEHRSARRTAETGAGIDGEIPDENLLDIILSHQELQGGELGFSITADVIKAIMFDVFAAGTGTSSATMSWAMSELIKNPRVMERAQEEVREVLGRRDRLTEDDISKLSYLKMVIKETLRLHPPAPLLLPRECTETCPIQGYMIPKNTRVVVNVWAMGRDPQYWDNPEDFKPERFDSNTIDFMGDSFEFIPFGAGRRGCPGMLFGLTTMEIALSHLLYYFDWKLPHGLGPDDLDMSESLGLGVNRKSDLYLHAIPYAPLPMG